MLRFYCIVFSLLSAWINANAQESDVSKLFRSEEPLSIRLGYSFKDIKKNHNDSVYFPTVIYYRNDQNNWDSLKIGVRGRGNFRRNNCHFTPIRIKIKKNEVKGTLFQDNKNLKLVLPCQYGATYNNLVMKEYLCYRLYEPLTPYTFNTRLLDVTLTDQRGKQNKTYEVRAFFIEDDDVVAKRFNGKATDQDVHPNLLNDTSALRLDFFQYMIANTDWSSSFQHNSKTIRTAHGYYPVAYDFDMSGFVNAPYATVNETLPISSVRERLYRGYCKDEKVTQYVRQDYVKSMPDVLRVIDQNRSYFSDAEFSGMKKYIQEFFDVLTNDDLFDQKILKSCRTQQ